MLRLLVALTACCSFFAQAEDLGRIGNGFPIAERDLREVFMAKAQAKVDDGSWKKTMEQQAEKMKAYAARPIGKNLPRAIHYSVRYFDPTIVLDRDVSDAEGNILYPKGTRVNPLDYRDYPRTLCFFNGDDKAQVEWASQYCFDPIKARAILTNGPVLDLSNKFAVRMFFDQYGKLVTHFGIKAVPSVVRQTGKVFAIEEFGVGP